MKRFNIVTKKLYTRNGAEKAQWNTVGSLVYFPPKDGKEGGFRLELHMQPDTKFYVFEQKPEAERAATIDASTNEEINPDEVPF